MRESLKLRDLISHPRKALFGQLTLYYAALAIGLYLLIRIWPAVADHLYSWSSAEPAPEDLSGLAAGNVTAALKAETALALLVSTIGALLLMIPVTWVYMGTRRRRGLDQSMVESLLMLPIAVAGVVVIVQDSLALAFSLAGIFAGIQFRSKLKFYADAHFMFAAIGVGLAAGIGALHVAGVMSFCFTYAAYAIWRLNYGSEAGARHLRYASEEAREVGHRHRKHHAEPSLAEPATTTETNPDAIVQAGSIDVGVGEQTPRHKQD